ncbi:MAG: VOC family protein [Cellvibrionaceae bacterium]|nr:VOC family protein [Cellvibrionaceae bacterium]
MKIEHFAFNVVDPVSIADWYCSHLGFSIKRKLETAPYTHFLADETGCVMIEIYNNPADDVPNYPDLHPLQLHLAFVSHDPVQDAERLIAAGAEQVDDLLFDDGTHLKMLKDPWGFSIQLCKRASPMV